MTRAAVSDQCGEFPIAWCGSVFWTRHADASGKYRVMLMDEPREVREFFGIDVVSIALAVVDDFGNLVRVP